MLLMAFVISGIADVHWFFLLTSQDSSQIKLPPIAAASSETFRLCLNTALKRLVHQIRILLRKRFGNTAYSGK
jgi:hypothetical protein